MTFIRFNDCTYMPKENLLQGPNGKAELRNQVQQLFDILLQAYPEVVSQETIMASVWPDTHVKETAVPQLILELRQALEQVGSDRSAITTVPRKGYRWSVPLDKAAPPQPRSKFSQKWFFLLLAGLLLLGFTLFLWPQKKAERDPGLFSIAMLPFHNKTGNEDLAWFELGFPDVIGQMLGRDPSLNTIPIADVLQQAESLALNLAENTSRQTLLRAMGADLLIQTAISQDGEDFILDFTFIQASKTPDLWRVSVSRPWDVVPALAEGLRNRIRLNLVLPTDAEEVALDPFTTQAYANGVHLLNLKEFAMARPYFEVVTARYPDHVMAKLYLAQCALKMTDYDSCLALCQQLIDAGNAIPPDLSRAAKHLLAELHFTMREYTQAKAIAEPLALQLAPDDNPDWAIKVYWLMGSIAISSGQRQDAGVWYQKALATARSHKMLAEEATSLWYFTTIFPFNQDNIPYLQEALDIASALGNKLLRAKLLNAIAHLIQSQGKHQKARDLYSEALEVRKAMKDQRGIGLGLLYLGNAETRFDTAKARNHFENCIAIFQDLKDAWNTINAYIYLSHLENIEGNFAAAIDQLDYAIDIAREANDQDAFYYITFNKVATELRRGDLGKARHYISQIRAEADLPPNKVAGALSLEALCFYSERQFEKAALLMDQAKSLEGNGWTHGFQRYYDLIVQAQIKGLYLPLPIEKDPATWLFE